jgi:hypothetical protein
LVIFFSVLGGLQVFGVLGLIVGPVVIAVTISLLDVVRRANAPRLVETAPAAAIEPVTPAAVLAPGPVPVSTTSTTPTV